MKKYPLIRIFTIFSIAAFVLVDIVLSLTIYGHLKNDRLGVIEEAAQSTIETVVKNDLEKPDFRSVVPRAKETRIKSDIAEAMNSYSIESITLTNSKKAVIMSGNPGSLGGQTRNSSVSLDKVISAEAPFAISNTYRLNTAGGMREGRLVFDMYVPAIYDGKVEGVFVLQMDDEAVSSHAKMIMKVITLTLSGGLLVLFLMLIGILYRTSRTLLRQNEELVEQKSEIEASYKKLDDSYRDTVIALSNAVDARDPYTAGHSARVTRISLLLSRELNMAEEDSRILEYAALFHDIGKLGVPDHILNKNGRLTDEEYESIRRHPDLGVSILGRVDFLSGALPIIRHHHERFDGNGYPSGIRGEQIPLGARIIAIADTYDAMTSDRPYRKGVSHDLAVQEILKNRGIQFDGKLVDAFMKISDSARDSV